MPQASYIIDSHAHLMKEYFGDDLGEVIKRAQEANVVQIVNPAVNLSQIPELIQLAERYPHVFIGVGLHPHEANSWNSESASLIKKTASHPKVVAIGECGLDFFYNLSDRNAQVQAFKAQIKLSRELNKPLIIHCRDAWEETFSILKQESGSEIRGVFHCFTGDTSMLSRIQELDFYVSFSGIVTFPKSLAIQEAARHVFSQRLLVETDCPFLAPQQMRGKRNEPSYVWMTAEKLAELRQTTRFEISEAVCRNAQELFGLPA